MLRLILNFWSPLNLSVELGITACSARPCSPDPISHHSAYQEGDFQQTSCHLFSSSFCIKLYCNLTHQKGTLYFQNDLCSLIKIASQLDQSLCRLDLASDIVIHPSHQKTLVSSRSGLNLRGRMRDPALKSSLAQAVEQDQPCSSTPLGGRNMGQGMVGFEVSQRLLINIPWLLGLYIEFWPAQS